jgi:tryptophanyl-tRNA synthetase
MKSKDQKEYQEKVALAQKIGEYYQDKRNELHLTDFTRIKNYLVDYLRDPGLLIKRGVVFAHMGFDIFTSSIVNGEEFTIVSGLNPSSPLHLGHKVLFDLLLLLQKLGATIFIPITNDESYVDGKAFSLKESRRMAYEEIIPSIAAFGFDPRKTKIFVDSDYPDLYNFAIYLSKNISNKYVESVFGEKSFDNCGKAFYRSAVQLAQILLPQLPEFGGAKNTLIPVGIDQHPYILLARDIARKMKYTPPSELVFKFQNSLKNPYEKMSGSKPDTAIFLNDSPDVIRGKIKRAYTGALTSLEAHKLLGGVPEACSVFSLLYFHHPDDGYVADIYRRYKKGTINMDELKKITSDFVIDIVDTHKKAKEKVKEINQFLIKTPLKSFL